MKGTIKLISVLLLAVMLITIGTQCFATDGVITGIENKIGTNYNDIKGADKIQEKAGTVIRIIRYVAIVASLILIAIFGVKFILGSAEEKAEYKKSFIPLIVGIVVVFGSTYIAQVIFSIAG